MPFGKQDKYENMNHPFILSIAGLDPSNGAGLGADLKVFQNLRLYGLSVCTALTVQNDYEFEAVYWTPLEQIIAQIDKLLERYNCKYIKIGIVENETILLAILKHLQSYNSEVKIVWDPVIKASAGFEFHKTFSKEKLLEILKEVYIVCPNKSEYDFMLDIATKEELLEASIFYVKSYGKDGMFINDLLFYENKNIKYFSKKKTSIQKHGSGCIFSSALSGYLRLNKDVITASREAHAYVQKYLNSSKSLLGWYESE